MADEWGEITFKFDWPDGLTSDDYEAGDEAEITVQYHEIVPPVPGMGEEVVFPDEKEPHDQLLNPGGPSRSRYLTGRVYRREIAYGVSRYGNRRVKDWTVTLYLHDVREWPAYP